MRVALNFLNSANSTLLCVGPLSSAIIDSSVALAGKIKQPILLVASRRQFDANSLNGGYVNHWSTEDFSRKYLPPINPFYAAGRDHGGPAQGNFEIDSKLDSAAAMQVAKKSFEVDIESGMEFIHIDPSVPVNGEKLTEAMAWERLTELYAHVVEFARKKNKTIYIEVGTEEQCGESPNPKEFEHFLQKLKVFTEKNRFPSPLFVVLQTGTKVQKMENIGLFERGNAAELAELMEKIKACTELAKNYGVHVKEHNADYLSAKHLKLRPSLGISASNVAPEFGVLETKMLLTLLQEYKLNQEYDQFCSITLQNRKWEKWLGSQTEAATDLEKVMIAGHYEFSHPAVKTIRNTLEQTLNKSGRSLEKIISEKINSTLLNYLQCFGYSL